MSLTADDGTEIITHRLEDLAATFLDLIDTPNTYVNAADFKLKVNLSENGVNFVEDDSVTTSDVLTDNFLVKGNGTNDVDISSVAEIDGRLTNVVDPIDAQDAATKTYVDSEIPNVKSGTIPSIPEGGNTSVVFNTAFNITPNVVVNFEGNVDHSSGEKAAVLSVYSMSTIGFTVRYDAASPGVDPTTNVQWIATSAGDP